MVPLVAPLASVARSRTLIYPAVETAMPRVLIHDNLDDDMRKHVSPAYAERVGRPDAVTIVELPPGARVFGPSLFLLMVEGQLVFEQVQPPWRDPGVPSEATSSQGPITDIAGEVMLIARYGERTWGHWLGELLPKIAVCERHFAGRFRYAVQRDCLGNDTIGQRLMESIAAYGVAPDRLISVSDGQYRFENLFAMTPVWSDRMMHPEVMATMQQTVRVPAGTGYAAGERIALLRGDNQRRQIVNLAETVAVLRDFGFHVIDIAHCRFAEQVSLFSEASLVFSILGSSLAGLIYARPGIGVISAAPAKFADRFFYAMMQAKAARYADLRGPVPGEPLALYRDSPFALAPPVLRRCLAVMTSGAGPTMQQTATAEPRPGEAPRPATPAPPVVRSALTPILVTAPGRSGTTLLMGLLAGSPEIALAALPPYEVRLLAYHAAVFATLTGPANFDRSHHPDRLEGDGFHVGSNPFSSPDYARAFHDDAPRKDYFERFVLARVARNARDLINEYYHRLAEDHGKTGVRFFAEKGNNMHRPSRMFARRAFGNVRELMLIRDPRDVLCSHVVYFGSAHDTAFNHLTGALRQFTVVKGENRSDVHMLRYEDVVTGDPACFEAMSAFLDTRIAFDCGAQGRQVFATHATSGSPDASMGRWRRDLPEALKQRCAREWRAFLTDFGYALA